MPAIPALRRQRLEEQEFKNTVLHVEGVQGLHETLSQHRKINPETRPPRKMACMYLKAHGNKIVPATLSSACLLPVDMSTNLSDCSLHSNSSVWLLNVLISSFKFHKSTDLYVFSSMIFCAILDAHQYLLNNIIMPNLLKLAHAILLKVHSDTVAINKNIFVDLTYRV